MGCCGKVSTPVKICLIVMAVVLAGVIGVGGYALHVYLNVWAKDDIVSLPADAFSCKEDCVTGIDHSLWDQVLKEVVIENEIKEGIRYNSVDFHKLSTTKELRDLHLSYLKMLEETDGDTLSQDEALAMMINAYNAFAVDLVVTKNPGSSIRDLTDYVKGSVFKRFKWKLKVRGKTVEVNLDSVEHKILRELIADYTIPEIHAGVNCVSLSCPDLRAEAFTGEKVREQLKEQSESWLQNEGKGLKLDEKTNTVFMSQLFKWFRGDFVSELHGGANSRTTSKEPLEWALQYATSEVRNYVEENNPRVEYLGYNWKLISPN